MKVNSPFNQFFCVFKSLSLKRSLNLEMNKTYVISLIAVKQKNQIREDEIGSGEYALEGCCGRVFERQNT